MSAALAACIESAAAASNAAVILWIMIVPRFPDFTTAHGIMTGAKAAASAKKQQSRALFRNGTH
jgi:hypothetical protein